MSRYSNRSPTPTNAAVWLAIGAAAGVLLGVTVADRGSGRKLLSRLTGALSLFERIAGQSAVNSGQRAAGSRLRDSDGLDDADLDDESDRDLDDGFDDDLGDEFETAEEFGESGFEYEDSVEDEGTGFEPDTEGDYIDARVLAAFRQDPVLSMRDIEIEELEPAVIGLSGRVLTAQDAKHAVTVARGVPGVERVENYIRVRDRAPVSPPPEEADV